MAQILRQQHRLTEEQENDFTIRNLAELVQTQQRVVKTQTGMLRNLAAVPLLLDGIRMMNIMLVSVTERTREIGIRLAIVAWKPMDYCNFWSNQSCYQCWAELLASS